MADEMRVVSGVLPESVDDVDALEVTVPVPGERVEEND